MKVIAIATLALGAVLIIAGIIQVYLQMMARKAEEWPPGAQTIFVSPKGIKASSAYPGVWMVGLGVALIALANWFG